MTHSRPFTADSLAERWGCSGETVRQMVKSGPAPARIALPPVPERNDR